MDHGPENWNRDTMTQSLSGSIKRKASTRSKNELVNWWRWVDINWLGQWTKCNHGCPCPIGWVQRQRGDLHFLSSIPISERNTELMEGFQCPTWRTWVTKLLLLLKVKNVWAYGQISSTNSKIKQANMTIKHPIFIDNVFLESCSCPPVCWSRREWDPITATNIIKSQIEGSRCKILRIHVRGKSSSCLLNCHSWPKQNWNKSGLAWVYRLVWLTPLVVPNSSH